MHLFLFIKSFLFFVFFQLSVFHGLFLLNTKSLNYHSSIYFNSIAAMESIFLFLIIALDLERLKTCSFHILGFIRPKDGECFRVANFSSDAVRGFWFGNFFDFNNVIFLFDSSLKYILIYLGKPQIKFVSFPVARPLRP